jgi:hypothetical protein
MKSVVIIGTENLTIWITMEDQTSQSEVEEGEEITHALETRRQGRVSEVSMGNRGKHALPRETRRQGRVSKMRTGNRGMHTLPRDEKARQSERDEDG